jgi:hypothetical protein
MPASRIARRAAPGDPSPMKALPYLIVMALVVGVFSLVARLRELG